MPQDPRTSRSALLRHSAWIGLGAMLSPLALRLASATDDFIRGPAVPDQPLQRLSPQVAMV